MSETSMTSARDDILSTIRRSLGVTGREAPRRGVVEGRLSGHPRGLVPQRGQLDGADRVALFKAQALAVRTRVPVSATPAKAWLTPLRSRPCEAPRDTSSAVEAHGMAARRGSAPMRIVAGRLASRR